MREHTPHPSNVPGDFYVRDICCTMCMVPFYEAPELFGKEQDSTGYTRCFVKRQPETPGELTKMLRAVRWQELDCIRCRGTDRRIQLELVEINDGLICDNLLPDLERPVGEPKRRPWWKF